MAEKLTPATPAIARVWLIQQLERIGRGECVEALAAALQDADPLVRESARRALVANPAPEAAAKLRVALAGAKDPNFKIAFINALAARGDHAVASALIRELHNPDVAVAAAAAQALGKVIGPEVFEQNKHFSLNSDPRVLPAFEDTWLRWAEATTNLDDKQAIYTLMLNDPQASRSIRMAALKGRLATTRQQKGGLKKEEAIILDVLAGNDRDAWSVALKEAGWACGVGPGLAAELAKLSPAAQVALLDVLGGRRCGPALPNVLAAVKSPNEKVSLAALRALGGVGDASVVPLLLEKTFAGGEPAAAARESLETIFAKGTDEILLERMKQAADVGQRKMLIEILDRRMVAAAVPALLAETANKDASVRLAAMTALSHLATPNDVAAILRAMFQTKDGDERREAQRTVIAICCRFAEYDQRAEPVLAVYNAASEEEKAVLLPLLGHIGGPKVYTLIQAAMAGGDAKWREVGFSALCNWPDARAADDLLKLAETAKNKDDRLRFLRAFARVVAIRSDGTPAEVKLPMLLRAMKLAEHDDERAMLVDRASGVYHVETLRLVAPYLDNPRIAQTACYTIVNLSHHAEIRRPNAAEFFHALDRVMQICTTPWLVVTAGQNKLLAQNEWVDQEMVKVEPALPKQAAAKPLKPRKLLVFTYCTGYPHDAMPLAAKTFQRMGQKTGAFEATLSDDPQIFAPESLKEFDAVFMNNCTGDPLPSAELKESLLSFVRGGKGIAGIHGTADGFYGELMGGHFCGHPFSQITVKLDDPQSPINAVFHGRGFDYADEIYTFSQPYSRQKLHVLLSIDWEKSAKVRESARINDGRGWKARKDNDYAVSWIHPCGQGRVFYSCLGHWHETYWNPVMLEHFLAGIQYALGDLPADAAPSAAGGTP
jgi:type 1 glutamine amidotransferase/HEAT repeat protein